MVTPSAMTSAKIAHRTRPTSWARFTESDENAAPILPTGSVIN